VPGRAERRGQQHRQQPGQPAAARQQRHGHGAWCAGERVQVHVRGHMRARGHVMPAAEGGCARKARGVLSYSLLSG